MGNLHPLSQNATPASLPLSLFLPLLPSKHFLTTCQCWVSMECTLVYRSPTLDRPGLRVGRGTPRQAS